jgi:hypothetical protein
LDLSSSSTNFQTLCRSLREHVTLLLDDELTLQHLDEEHSKDESETENLKEDATVSSNQTCLPNVLRGQVFAMDCTGDGNCLYRAVSLALIGNESLWACLKYATAIELVKNRTIYLPFLELNADTTSKFSPFKQGVLRALDTGKYWL